VAPAFLAPDGPVAQRLEPTAHNGLVGGSNPPGPTTQFTVFGDFPRVVAKARTWRGFVRPGGL
jgi:hypothetical protein